nr:WYL domain-containing protein [Nakamurella sp. PAMC28650]
MTCTAFMLQDMPTTSAPTTSSRLLVLLSLLQARRDWPGGQLAERLEVSERTVRRDIDRLRTIGYPIRAVKGPGGGYQLAAGTQLPPLLFDDEQAVALAVALRTAVITGAGIEEAAARALTTLRQVMPARLRARIDALELTSVNPAGQRADLQADTDVLLAIGESIRAREELRFHHRPAGATGGTDDGGPRPHQVEPHHLVVRAGRWYLIAWEARHRDWRIYRADRISPRTPNGPRFTARGLPGGDVGTFLAARLKGANGIDAWPCTGEVVLGLPVAEVIPFAGDGIVQSLGPDRCRLRLGSWSWPGLAAYLARFDADIEVLDPPELRTAFADLARRAGRAAGIPPEHR